MPHRAEEITATLAGPPEDQDVYKRQADLAGNGPEAQCSLTAALDAGDAHHAVFIAAAVAPDLQQGVAADQLHSAAGIPHRQCVAPRAAGLGCHRAGHLTVRRQQQDHLLAGFDLGQLSLIHI